MVCRTSLTAHRIIPVVVIKDASRATGLASALVAGGLPVAEVTLRTPEAAEALRLMAEDARMLVGAGSVLTADQVDLAVDHGARFVVSPGLSEPVVCRARDRDVFVLPGATTASEVLAARDLGLHLVKFFPASACGGPAAVKALGQPFGDMAFVPTGGVDATNLASYLALAQVPAVGGSWMVRPDLVEAGDFDTITRLTREAVALTQEER